MSVFPVTCGAVYNRDGKRKFSFHCQLCFYSVYKRKKENAESLCTLNFLFGLLRVANCAWFCLNRFCRGVNKGQFID